MLRTDGRPVAGFEAVDGVLRWISPGVHALLGWTPDELVGRGSSHLVHPDDLRPDGRHRQHSIVDDATRSVLRLVRKDGSFAFVELTFAYFLPESGGRGVIGVMRDATEQMAVERELDDSRTRLRALLEATHSPYALLEPVRNDAGTITDFVYAEANPAVCAFEGVTYDELLGSSFLGLHPAAVQDGLLGRLAQVVETGEPYVRDAAHYPLERFGGDDRWFGITCNRVGHGVGVMLRDVTERYRALQEIERSNADFRLLAENASDVVFRIGLGGELQWLSPSVHELLGWEPDDLVALPFAGFLHPDDRPNFTIVLTGMIPGVPATFNARVLRADGDFHWVSVLLRPVREEGDVVAYAGSWRDIQVEVDALRENSRIKERHQLLQLTLSEVVALEVEGVLEWASASLTRLLGWGPSELVGTTLEHLCDPRDRRALTEALTETRGGEQSQVVARLLDTDGNGVWVEITARPWITADDRDGVAINIRDYRDQHHAARALLRAQTRATGAPDA